MFGSDVAGRRLALLVGAVVVSGAGCVVWAAVTLDASVPLAYPAAFAALVAVAGSGTVFVWPRSQHQITTTTGAILAAVIVLPASWAIFCTVVGVALAKAIRRQTLVKAAFNVGKETVGATAAAGAASAVGLVPVSVSEAGLAAGWGGWSLALVAATLAYAVADEVLPVPVIALASRTPWRQVAARAWDVRTAARGVDVLAAAVTVVLAVVDMRLLVLIPAGMAIAYLTYTHRLRLREERRAWQQLAAATKAIAAAGSNGDLTHVLHTAAGQAAALFPAAVAEVELAGRLVRADARQAGFDGPAGEAPPAPGAMVETSAGGDGEPPVRLRLRFPHDNRLAEREPHLLETLAGAVATAVQNTAAHATVVTLAQRSRHEALHDPLTELPNRRHLFAHVTDLLSNAQPGELVALMLVDLDHFKDVNDAIGHAAGDRVLHETARRLQGADPDALVARLGGDEFAVVFTTSANQHVATARAEKILKSLREPMNLDGVPIGLDASAGLAITTDRHVGCDELLARADVAMYRAKGSDRPLRLAIYSRSQDRSDTARLTLRAEVPLAATTGAWELVYQPVVDLATGTVVGATAQTRWHHLDMDRLPPARALGILQRAGQLPAFVNAMLHRALDDAAGWSARGLDLSVTVTLTPQAIAAPELEPAIRAALAAHDLSPRRLTIQLAYTNGVGHTPAETNLGGLHAAGVRVALDGAGTASLTMLQQLPVDELKIAARFVVDPSAGATGIVSAIVELARRFEVPVCAEGIEQHRQRRSMWELGCTHGQGPLFGRPMAADALLSTLEHGYDGTPGRISRPLQNGGTVIRLPRKSESSRQPR